MALTVRQRRSVLEDHIPVWIRRQNELALISPIEYDDGHDPGNVAWIRVRGDLEQWTRLRDLVTATLQRYATAVQPDAVPVSLEYYGTSLDVDPVCTELDAVKSIWTLDEEKDLSFRVGSVYLHLSLWELHLDRYRLAQHLVEQARIDSRTLVQISWRLHEKHSSTVISTAEVEAHELFQHLSRPA